ncbi:hypothetical protein LL974_16905 [Xanthomonas campestris pv. cannae]|nr:hypothetical protein [Xanthomonas campestris pv. cannae]
MNKDDLNKNIDDDAILAVASLLKSDSCGKKYRAARILGAMGGRARNAIPYLRAADVEPKPASNLDDLIDPYPEQKFIELAIQRIQGGH